ncbi:MAG: hypothetical protein EBS84_22950, partial [Proteobacteria bacterium]|nr:hypothetical protein [Pseudomonadota bacterium]
MIGVQSDALAKPLNTDVLNPEYCLTLSGASAYNLKNLTISIPLGRFVCLTGVSGSGKSTLVRDCLLPALAVRLSAQAATAEPAATVDEAAAESPDPRPRTLDPNLQTPPSGPLATLLDYLPDDAIILLSDPEALEAHAESYTEQIPEGSPFFAGWPELRGELLRRKMTVVALMEEELPGGEESGECVLPPPVPDLQLAGEKVGKWESEPDLPPPLSLSHPPTFSPAPTPSPLLTSLEAFRPIADRMPTQEVALAQRQMFFQQLASWLRQGFYVQIVCNNDGEAQRFQEVWGEMSLGEPVGQPETSADAPNLSQLSANPPSNHPNPGENRPTPGVHISSLPVHKATLPANISPLGDHKPIPAVNILFPSVHQPTPGVHIS